MLAWLPGQKIGNLRETHFLGRNSPRHLHLSAQFPINAPFYRFKFSLGPSWICVKCLEHPQNPQTSIWSEEGDPSSIEVICWPGLNWFVSKLIFIDFNQWTVRIQIANRRDGRRTWQNIWLLDQSIRDTWWPIQIKVCHTTSRQK